MAQFYDYDRVVDIYEYDAIDRYYKGKSRYYQKKGTGLLAHSTDIPIPVLGAKEGFIYVFKKDIWEEVEDKFNKIVIEEINYVFSDNIREVFGEELIKEPILYFPQYPVLHSFINSHLKAMFLSKKIYLIQKKYFEVKKQHNLFIQEIKRNSFDQNNLCTLYKVESEFLVMMMKTVIDELVQLTFIMSNYELIKRDLSFEKIDSLGGVFFNNQKFKITNEIILGNDNEYETDKTGFLKILNDLFNSIKHSSLHHESYASYPEIPNVVTYYVKNNKLSSYQVEFHNHSLAQIMCGFIENFERIIRNQKKYLTVVK